MKRAIKIDVQEKNICFVHIYDNETIYREIGNGCTLFCCPVRFENDDFLFADDESLLRLDDIKGGFIMEGWQTPIVGNALIIGTDEEGESVNAKSDIDAIREKTIFIDENMAKDYAVQALSTPPKIFTF